MNLLDFVEQERLGQQEAIIVVSDVTEDDAAILFAHTCRFV